jgi:GT2 family glycosyltransferase
LKAHFSDLRNSIRAQVPDSEFIIVDNASTDGSADYCRAHWPGVRVHAEPKNLFFGPAANQGVALAQGEFVLLLNPDVAVDRFSFPELLDRFRGQPSLFAVQPRIRDPRSQEEERLFALAFRRGVLDVRRSGPARESAGMGIPFATGCAVFFRRDLFLRMGGFDPIFSPFYWEDVELGIRAVRLGWTNLHLAGCRFFHWHSTIIGRSHDEQMIRATYERNRLLCFYKHVSPLSWMFAAHLAWLLPRLLRSLIGDRLFWQGFWACLARFGGLRSSRRRLAQGGSMLPLAAVMARFPADAHE